MLDYVLYIGRFQPFHNGHLETIKHALTLSAKVIICIGSAQECRTTVNPFTVNERVALITSVFPPEERLRLMFIKSIDMDSNSRWAEYILDQIGIADDDLDVSVGIIGFSKGSEQQYIKYFPSIWRYIPVTPTDLTLHASDIRREYFKLERVQNITVPTKTFLFLLEFKGTLDYTLLRDKLNDTQLLTNN